MGIDHFFWPETIDKKDAEIIFKEISQNDDEIKPSQIVEKLDKFIIK